MMRFPSRLFVSLFGFGLSLLAPAALFAQAAPVATGDTRTVTEPSFPATCQQLQASFHDVNEDVPASVESGSTNLDQARLQAALTACANTGQAVELSMDSSGDNAFLSGPLTIPTGVVLLVDPGVTLYFSRNAQDYDTTPGTHTCGTVNGNSATSSCKNLISITSANGAGVMGFGKLNGRGGDVVLNSFPTAGYESSTAGKSWWDLAADANSDGGSQQNPRGIQISSSNNVTLYKITFKNPPMFHVTMNTVNGFTAWDVKIITPYSARNTDGIDPGNATNVTVKNSSISDGDDNIAVGAPSSLSSNISIVNNRFYAGHGESIGSYTSGGVNNVLFDSNALYGDADLDGGNSTGIRIKSANDRGGLVQNIQYSNSCFANHGTQIQFTPLYNSNAGTLTPNFKNILLQNLRFSSQGPVATGSFTFLGASNNGTVNPLVATLDNVTVDTVASSNLVAPTNAQITLGPGQVSSTFANLLLAYNGTNGNVITDNRTASALVPPACTFTFLSPELTGPGGVNQTVAQGQYPTAVVILSPAISNAAYPYPTGTVTVTDEANRTFSATLSGSGDTVFIPITNAPVGTHTYTASYAGNSVYAANGPFGNYSVTVTAANLQSTTLNLSGVPAASTYGSAFTATATLTSSSTATSSVSFLVNGSVYATVPVSGGTAQYSFNLPVGSYTVSAVYAGDSSNAASSSATTSVAVSGAQTTTSLAAASTTAVVGTPVNLTATVTSSAGTPTGTVTFYTNAGTSTATTLGTATLTNGQATYSAQLPQGTDTLTATYTATGNFNGSASTNSVVVTVSAAPPVPAGTLPLALPYTISTVAGGAASASANTSCTGHADNYGDGCQATQIYLAYSGEDLRSVVADPFGNLYFTDANAQLVRRIASNGVVSQFAGYLTGTACVPTATIGCTPTLVKLSGKPRGLWADAAGNVYIAGYGSNQVYVVRVADGKLYLVAGSGSAPTSTSNAGDGGAAASALMKGPRGVATDTAGNIYIADSGDNLIREVLSAGSATPGTATIQTVAGLPGNTTAASSGDGGLATAANVNNPQGVLTDPNGNIYIAEASRVRAVCVSCTQGTGLYALLVKLGYTSPTNGDIYTIDGATNTNGTAINSSMSPQKLAMDPDGNLYISDSSNNVVWFQDFRTGVLRVLAGGGSATSCPGSAIGDGCVGTQAVIGSGGGNGLGVGLDQAGNLLISDTTNSRIRRVSNNLRFASDAVGTAVQQTVKVHFLPGDTPSAPTLTSRDFTLGAGTCTTNSDTTTDCLYPTTFSPAVAGQRTAPVSFTTSMGNNGVLPLSGLGLGGGATLDPAAQTTLGQNLQPAAIAVDPNGNVYVADAASKSLLRYAAGSSTATTVQTFTTPAAVALDASGDVFVADSSTGRVSEITAAGTTRMLSATFSAPDGLAVDSLGNLYVSDAAAKTVTEIGANLLGSRVVSSGLNSPAALAADSNNNVFLADPGAGNVYRIDAQTFARTTASTAATTPQSLAVDAAGNLLVGDTTGAQVLAIPASANSSPFSVVGNVPGTALALDAAGNVYTTGTGGTILKLLRTQATATYNGPSAPSSTLTLLSTGNQADALSLADPDQTNFKLAVQTSTDCTGSASSLGVAVGGVCQFTSSFTPSAAQNYQNTATFSGNANNAALGTPAVLEIVQTGNNAPVTTMTAFTSVTPANPNIASTITFTVSVTASTGTPTGSVAFALDGGTPFQTVQLSGGSASASVSNLSAGQHTVTATYTSSSTSFSGSTKSTTIQVSPVTATMQNVWIVNGNGTLSELSNSGGALSSTSGYAGGGSGITIDSAGSVWSGVGGGTAVSKLSNTGALLGTFSGGGISSPTGLAVSGTGYIWIANGNGTLSELDNNGNPQSPSAGFNGGGLSNPTGVAIDSAGNVWVTNGGDSSLTEFLGAADPVVTPKSTAAGTATQGTRP